MDEACFSVKGKRGLASSNIVFEQDIYDKPQTVIRRGSLEGKLGGGGPGEEKGGDKTKKEHHGAQALPIVPCEPITRSQSPKHGVSDELLTPVFLRNEILRRPILSLMIFRISLAQRRSLQGNEGVGGGMGGEREKTKIAGGAQRQSFLLAFAQFIVNHDQWLSQDFSKGVHTVSN